MVLAPQLLHARRPDPATVLARVGPRSCPRRKRRTRLPIDLETATEIMDESIRASSIPIILGSRPLDGAVLSLANGLIQVHRRGVQLILDRTQDRRLIRGYHPRWMIEVESRLLRTTEGWREVFSQLAEYASVEELCDRCMPVRRQSTRLNQDGGVVTVSISRAVSTFEDVIRRTSTLARPDGTRVEEQEEMVRVADREQYELVRTEYDAQFRPLRTFNYAYPQLSQEFYRPIRARLESWDEENDWLERTVEW
jgi:hypothetical protein